MTRKERIRTFRDNVGDKYVIYNALFSALPFSGVANVGALLPLFCTQCEDGFAAGKSPAEIIDGFFAQQEGALSEADKMDRLFKFVQYIERQVVLFDAIEDAAFPTLHDLQGTGSLKRLIGESAFAGKEEALREKLRDFKIRIVLTAHPTQFYPGSVLGIIHDMAKAIGANDFATINQYIRQLGITPFFNKQRPTPYDEAVNLMWYLENVFYDSLGNIYNNIVNEVFDGQYTGDNRFVELGFWPGGDRDGNPFVDAATTLRVGAELRTVAILCYYRDVRRLRRRLTFREVDKRMAALEALLYENVFLQTTSLHLNQNFLLGELAEIRELIVKEHHGLYLSRLDSFINKVKIFGTHFASLDVRQESTVHNAVLLEISDRKRAHQELIPADYIQLSEVEKIAALSKDFDKVNADDFDGMAGDTLKSVAAIRQIQKANGEAGCHRYIISQCHAASQVLELRALLQLGGFGEELPVDLVPLFETIEDLKAAEEIMQRLYESPLYQSHLQTRGGKQYIMLGFSDGTKDGGYLQANWSIFKAKERLSSISERYGVAVTFFDGRGGPPARGGGKTHQFYASLGKGIASREIQLTVQGQTISSNFGTRASAQYNLEQLLTAGLRNGLFADPRSEVTADEAAILHRLAEKSFETYSAFKAHPLFMDYLIQLTPLRYYADSNIASRPAKRSSGNKLRFEDLRAIPFVGSWSQIKQNVPGFFGLGTALENFAASGDIEQVKNFYQRSLFFKTLIDNSMMSMQKSFFPLTAFIDRNPEYGPFRRIVLEEFERTKKWVLVLTGSTELMEEETHTSLSIQLREKIVLPLLTIQQFAIQRLNEKQDADDNERRTFEKLITRSMFGIINAARNSV